MGYMGFGMKKEVYTRKPRKTHAYLKNLYGKQLTRHLSGPQIAGIPPSTISEENREFIRERVRESIKQDTRQRIVSGFLVLFLTLVGLFALVWLLREWFVF